MSDWGRDENAPENGRSVWLIVLVVALGLSAWGTQQMTWSVSAFLFEHLGNPTEDQMLDIEHAVADAKVLRIEDRWLGRKRVDFTYDRDGQPYPGVTVLPKWRLEEWLATSPLQVEYSPHNPGFSRPAGGPEAPLGWIAENSRLVLYGLAQAQFWLAIGLSAYLIYRWERPSLPRAPKVVILGQAETNAAIQAQNDRDWEAVLSLLSSEVRVTADPRLKEPIDQLVAVALTELGRFDEATDWLTGPDCEAKDSAYTHASTVTFFADSFEQSLAISESRWRRFAHPDAAYNVACALVRLGRTEEALPWLERSAEAGFANFDSFEEDSDLDPLRELPGFPAISERIRTNAQPS